MLSLKQITKDYVTGDETVHALKGVDIEFRESEFVSILGQSGCGKTTLLNIIGGLDRYTDGDLVINGKSTKQFKDSDWDTYRNHSIGFVFQSYNLIPHQTVLSNVELALTLSGVSKAERRKRAVEVLEQVGLGDQLNKKPNQMSGGQMQRVAIARALVNDPDILLADEPTGALDSATSVQIMELLKNISKDKLIIMVTHNPELAQQYSTRIIKLKDGRVTDDSDPYSANVVEPIKNEEKQKADKKKGKKTSMSFATALSLSKNNLMTKKARTLLTSFAGSIGIIGIALILSLSNGVQTYIDAVQEDTLSSYPLTITETSTDMTKMMQAMAETQNNVPDRPLDKIYSGDRMSETLNTMLSETTHNNMAAFKKYLDDNKSELDKYTSDIQYGYSTQMNIYRADTDNGLLQVNPTQVWDKIGMDDSMGMMSTAMTMNGMNVWAEMINNDDILSAQYDVIAGRMPEKAEEIVVVVNKYNELDDFALYTLGLKSQDELKGIFNNIMKGETFDNPSVEFSYDDILGLEYKLILNSDYYKKSGDKWVDMSKDESYMKSVVDNGITLKVVGIIRPNEEASAASINGSLGYRHDLTELLINKVNDSEIVKQQLADPDTNVFSGKAFASTDDSKGTDGSSEAAPTRDELLAMIDVDTLTDQQKAMLEQMSDEDLAAMMQSMGSQQGEDSDTTYEENLTLLGVSDLDKPDTINIYPKDFAAKEHITDLIEKYNTKATDENREEDVIQYTDMVGLMMSSVTSIIDAISYVLIAFVAISLVVSSIMIGIITYISVLERTKEIGILRSIGASKKDISRVFNAETLIVGFTAGAMGIIISYLLTIPINQIIAHVTDAPVRASIPVAGAVILIVISMLLTLIAGLFPSRVAAKKDPVIALRTE